MKSFEGKLAVVTGGGTGMGRSLVIQLAEAGASVAMCDVQQEAMNVTAELAAKAAADGVRITAHLCDVSDETQVLRFRDEVVAQHDTASVNLVFNNAGIGGGGGFVNGDRADWERTFGVDWFGVYYCCRAFVPLLVASDEGHLVNTSSVNGFWASLGPGISHTSYSAAKFAVKGFTEALIEDFRINAPHVNVSVVMPGHIGTEIATNSYRLSGASPSDPALAGMSQEEIDRLLEEAGNAFRDNAPMTADEAATVILDGVRAGQWRILVGDDAHALDRTVRADPESVYGPAGINFLETIRVAAATVPGTA